MKANIIFDEKKPYSVMVDDKGVKYICDLGVNDQGYLSAQHCWEVQDRDIIERLSK